MRAVLLLLLVLFSLPALAQTVPQSRDQVRLSFSPLVKSTAPAVVNVYTRKVVQARGSVSPLFNDPFFRQFFGEQFGMGMPQERIQRSLGSGVLVSADGVVVTNLHVINESDEITVVLSDKREFEAKIVGEDPRTDLAVLRIEVKGEKLPYLSMGDSDALEVGDMVMAIGNPFGVGQTVTTGIVSALARTTVGVSDFQFFIQTDAAINPGNSGGALVGMDGKLIGINSAIYSKGGGSNGIGFAIPASMVKATLTGILSTGHAVRPWLGAQGQEVTSDIAQSLKLAKPVGVLIASVVENGPAEKAGLKRGDVVISVNGYDVFDTQALRFRIATLGVGETAQLKLIRQGRETTVAVPLIAPPEKPPRDLNEVGGRNPFTGATVANLNPALTEELGIDGAPSGVMILSMKRGSPAHQIGLRPGDIIERVNGAGIALVADLKKAVQTAGKSWQIQIKREGRSLAIQVGG
ncbi:MAG: DegQ family serine endoprotease [Alphaproteobacteria bacterium]|nr:DegQ family serine endoprotease [Alphaproteobacteria bacterium]